MGLSLEVALSAEAEFEQVDNWVWSFVDLGKRLSEMSQHGSRISRLVLAVPNRDLVTMAISLGISIHRFSVQEDVLGDSAEVGQIPEGVKLRLEWPTRVVVGRYVRSELVTRGSDTFFKIVLTVNGSRVESTMKYASAIRVAPDSLPEGTYENSNSANPIQLEWERQALPGALVFGDGEYWKSQMDILLKSKDLPEIVVNSPAKAFEICRMDQLTPVDKFPHFINVFERITKFPEPNSDADSVLDSISICIFDGNGAIDALFEKRRLDQMLCVGVFETGTTYLQEQALSRIKNATSHLYDLSNPESIIGWTAPSRTFVMGWAREN